MSKLPDRIYLQFFGDAEDGEPGTPDVTEATWAAERVYARDVEYVRADLAKHSGGDAR